MNRLPALLALFLAVLAWLFARARILAWFWRGNPSALVQIVISPVSAVLALQLADLARSWIGLAMTPGASLVLVCVYCAYDLLRTVRMQYHAAVEGILHGLPFSTTTKE